jgi:two-component system sensor histidine kinase TctE
VSTDPSRGAATARRPSLKRQLLLGLLLPLVAIFAISTAVAYKVAFRFATEAFDRSLFDNALDLSRQIRYQSGRITVDVPRIALEMLEYDESDRVYYAVRSPGGDIVLGQRGLPEPPDVIARKPIYYDGNYRGDPVRLVAFHVPVNPDADGEFALVQVAETLLKREHLAQEILLGIAASQLVLIVLACASVWKGVGHALAPLEDLRGQLLARSHRDLSPIAEARVPAEVRPLVDAINDLLRRLSEAQQSQQRFVAEAAHQLRTPIAGLKTQAELALRQTSFDDVRTSLVHLHTAADRGTHLVNQLLALARAEPGSGRKLNRQPLDLVALARDATLRAVQQAVAKDIDLGFDPHCERAILDADPVMLGEMLANLVDNAIRYTQPGGTVTVSVTRVRDHVAIQVADNGPGIPEAERERVFERFHRVLGSGAEGCGLGLAIVREIADAHDARIGIEAPSAGTGTIMAVSFAGDAIRTVPLPDVDAASRGAPTLPQSAA